MKKLLFVCAFAASLLLSNTTNAQQKIGYFDDQLVLSWHPGLVEKLTGLMTSYQQDSLGVDYNWTYSDFMKKDSTFKKDSATMPQRVRDLAVKEMNQLKDKLINWQEYARQMSEQKQESILYPYKMKLAEALKAVMAEGKYTMVLNQSSLTIYALPPASDNLNIKVAQKLKIPIPKEYEDAFKAPAAGAPATTPGGTARPGGKQ
jgi:outer membrane protein